ncbi:MAG: hypothetical protein IT223_02215 [Crocinitomicaceae bacterium]|nr:hypothetical protein [Crocinitomicaceae bacterium]
MISKILVILPLLFSFFMQDDNVQRHVMRKHPNGKPYVVLYFNASSQALMKEEVFFANGNLQWTGTYKNDIEDGNWTYYYENGRKKSEQHYTRGIEEGTFTDFDESGRMSKQTEYSNGKTVRETNY